jgi:hypothetical protein
VSYDERPISLVVVSLLYFRVELACNFDDDSKSSSIFLTSDGRVILQGREVSQADRQALMLPDDIALISIDRSLIRAIKDML